MADEATTETRKDAIQALYDWLPCGDPRARDAGNVCVACMRRAIGSLYRLRAVAGFHGEGKLVLEFDADDNVWIDGVLVDHTLTDRQTYTIEVLT